MQIADGGSWHASGARLLDAPQRTRAESGPSLFTAYWHDIAVFGRLHPLWILDCLLA
jgi:hypothetical protein